MGNNKKPLALIIDDEKSICDSLAGVLSDEGWKTIYALSGKEGIKQVVQNMPDLILLDVWMSGMDGITTLQKIKQLQRDIPVVIMSGHATIDTAVRATKLGAFDFLEKPLSLDKVLPMLEHAMTLKEKIHSSSGIYGSNLIGRSENIKAVRKQIQIVAPKNAWILITGENGTGKEVVAHQIHIASTRADKAFVAINCAAIPEELIESELFGYEKGAFTNALSQKKGKFEIANKGTLFLDEIADMSLRTQAKILRILQEKQFERLGGHEVIDVDVRVIAATNKNLDEEIASGNFREDLFYRLNVVPFYLAPLRERREDILDLAEYFLETIAKELGEEKKILSSESINILEAYSWPGNVRELHNVIERLCIMVESNEIKASDLPSSLYKSGPFIQQPATTLKQAKNNFEKSFILEKLRENDWNISKTADAIGIERSNLHKKMKTFDIDTKQLKG